MQAGSRREWQAMSRVLFSRRSGPGLLFIFLCESSTVIIACKVDFDPGPGSEPRTAPPLSVTDAFIVKLSADGELMWVHTFGRSGNTNHDLVYEVAVGAANEVYAVGRFGGMADFDPVPGTQHRTASGTGPGEYDRFVLNLQANGDFGWVSTFRGSFVEANGLALDAAGNPLITGRFVGTTDFDPSDSNTFNLSALNSDADLFAVKLDTSGAIQWARRVGGAGGDTGASIEVAANGKILVAGGFSGSPTSDPGAIDMDLTALGSTDGLLLTLNS